MSESRITRVNGCHGMGLGGMFFFAARRKYFCWRDRRGVDC